jgi:hypothetical protein
MGGSWLCFVFLERYFKIALVKKWPSGYFANAAACSARANSPRTLRSQNGYQRGASYLLVGYYFVLLV